MLYYMISAAIVYGNVYWYVLYFKVGPVILGSAESAMPCVYCCLPMMSL